MHLINKPVASMSPVVTNTTYALHSYDFLFMLDVLARLPIDDCGADHTVDIGIMSVATMVPLVVWVGMFVMMWNSPELYITIVQMMLMVLTTLQVAMQYMLMRSGPIPGCGPTHAWPCPQVTLVAFGMCNFLCYSTDIHAQAEKRIIGSIAMVTLTIHAVLFIGFSDAASATAGVVLGGWIAYSEHELVSLVLKRPKWLEKIKWAMELIMRRKLVDTVLMVPRMMSSSLPSVQRSRLPEEEKPLIGVATVPLHMGIPVTTESDDD